MESLRSAEESSDGFFEFM